ncbi:hypothetical protein BJ875DRAFT_442231 [Amylocarpus encephaloides]|uniref:Uncharacterized protein n=1 Tax=Amylocarpus encephaloides TaxID=45428 RepID=A0A9P8C4S5_9HELO|nr:hypothetical protein BJ875DRAFT_442231 [Amylocarpus encephaloides]
MDYIETPDAEMLSETWTNLCRCQNLRVNLFRDLSRIILSLNAYYTELLACHDNHIRKQPNSIVDKKDGRAQIANLIRDARASSSLHKPRPSITSRAVDELKGDELQTFEKAY